MSKVHRMDEYRTPPAPPDPLWYKIVLWIGVSVVIVGAAFGALTRAPFDETRAARLYLVHALRDLLGW